MKKGIFLILSATFMSCLANGQTTLAGWTFPTGTSADAAADQGIASAFVKVISAEGTSAIDFSKNGNTTKSAQATGWDGGNDKKFWQVMRSKSVV